MELVIEQGRGTKRDVKLLREAVPFMLHRLLEPESFKRVRLNIHITRLHKDHGSIDLEDSPRFRLRLHHESDAILMLMTLAHELVHLQQVITGRLKFKKIKGIDVWVWDGKSYGSNPYAAPHAELPWESDAEGHESDMVRHFVLSHVEKLNAS